MVGRWGRHGGIQHVGVQMKKRLVYGLARVFDFEEHLLLGYWGPGKLPVPESDVPVLPEQMADKVPEVATEVNR